MVVTILAIIIVFFIIGIISATQTNKKIENNKKEITESLKEKNFKESKVITSTQSEKINQIRIDSEHNVIAIIEVYPYKHMRMVKFSDIVECEIIEDSNTIMKGGIGRAIVGNAIAGGVGAVVGATTRKSRNVVSKLQIRIITKNINNSLISIELLTKETQKETQEYKSALMFANNVYSTIVAIINKTNNIETKDKAHIEKKSQQNIIEQLDKLTQLKKDGTITEEEFKKFKKDIMKNQENDISQEKSKNNEDVIFDDDVYHIEEKIQMYGINDKISILKALREETGLGLKEAKDIVDEYCYNRSL